MGIILNIIGDFLSTAQKHNRQDFEHNLIGRGLYITVRNSKYSKI